MRPLREKHWLTFLSFWIWNVLIWTLRLIYREVMQTLNLHKLKWKQMTYLSVSCLFWLRLQIKECFVCLKVVIVRLLWSSFSSAIRPGMIWTLVLRWFLSWVSDGCCSGCCRWKQIVVRLNHSWVLMLRLTCCWAADRWDELSVDHEVSLSVWLTAAGFLSLTCSCLVLVSGSGCGLSGYWAHPGEQGPQDEEAHVPCPRTHQPLHELPLPHRDDPDREGADRPQTRGGGGSEEEGEEQQEEEEEVEEAGGASDPITPSASFSSWCCTDDHLGHLWMNHENKLWILSSSPVGEQPCHLSMMSLTVVCSAGFTEEAQEAEADGPGVNQ